MTLSGLSLPDQYLYRLVTGEADYLVAVILVVPSSCGHHFGGPAKGRFLMSKHPHIRAHLKFFIDSSQHPDPVTLDYLARQEAEVIDLHPHLTNPSDRYLDEFMSLCVKDAECGGYYAISPISTARLLTKSYLDNITFLTPEGVPGNLSIYSQVSAIIGYAPAEPYATAYSTNGAAGALAAGASLDEVKRLALSHRLLAGGNMRDEATAASFIGNILPLKDDAARLVYEFHSTRCDPREEFVRRSLLDYVLIRNAKSDPARELALIISACDSEGDVTSMTTFATSHDRIRAAADLARQSNYGIGTFPDERHGLYVLNLYTRNVTFPAIPAKDFSKIFTD